MDLIELVELLEDEDPTIPSSRRYLADMQDPFRKYDASEFSSRFRFTKEAVIQLYDMIKKDSELMMRSHAVPGLLQLAIALRFYATGHFQKTDGDLGGVSRPTVHRIIHRISRCLARQKPLFLGFPPNLENAKREFYAIDGFPGVVGAIDCTHIPIVSPGGNDAEVYRNRKGYFSVNVQAICNADRTFSNIVVRWPGSTHDARIFENSTIRDAFENGHHDGIVLGDAGYPCKRYLLTPLSSPQAQNERRYNQAHIHTRVRIEQSFGVLKQRFRALRIPVRTRLDNTLTIIVALFCLHNFAIRTKQPLYPDAFDDDEPPVPPVNITSHLGRSVRQHLIAEYF